MLSKRQAFIVHAVAQARAFHRSFMRLLSGSLHDQQRAEQARRRRDSWLDSARRAKDAA
jgi:hypothetical protein